MIPRILQQTILKRLSKGKAIILLGPRQTGKTTLLTSIADVQGDYLTLNCDDLFIREQLEKCSLQVIKQLIGSHKLVLVDEAQRAKNIGLTLKLIIDNLKHVQLLVSGSSALELANEINEPLTGRKWEYMLYPISWREYCNHFGNLQGMQQLEQRLVFGMYPEVINSIGNEVEVLKLISDSYLYKDLLSYKGIRKPELLHKLLKALAFQVGSEVSYNELSNSLQIDKNTVSNYIDLLEKAFVIFKLQPLSRNLRNEISTTRKIYFYDNGIRNILINNTNPLEYRNDIGALWENFLISERVKHTHYVLVYSNCYFWRTHQQKEIDYIEERDGVFHAYEFKWNQRKKSKLPELFSQNYQNVDFRVIDQENYFEFLGL
ncbi:MAG TPA: ATP-binding protein [Tenuifilaceae bacterium]|nr:ATP-binding protein [Tenuifilaceae bacterium]